MILCSNFYSLPLLSCVCAGRKVAQASGAQQRIFVAQFLPDSSCKFVSCGVKHVRFWSLVGTQLTSKRGHIPTTLNTRMQTMLSLAFAPVRGPVSSIKIGEVL